MNKVQLLESSNNIVSVCVDDKQIFSFEISQLSEAKYVFILKNSKVFYKSKVWIDTFSDEDNSIYKQNKEILKKFKFKTLLDLIFDNFNSFIPMMIDHINNKYRNTKKELLLYHITPDGRLIRFCRYNKPSERIYIYYNKPHR